MRDARPLPRLRDDQPVPDPTSAGNRGQSCRTRAIFVEAQNERDLKLDYFSHVFADFAACQRTPDELRADLPPSLRKLVEESEIPEIDPEDEHSSTGARSDPEGIGFSTSGTKETA